MPAFGTKQRRKACSARLHSGQRLDRHPEKDRQVKIRSPPSNVRELFPGASQTTHFSKWLGRWSMSAAAEEEGRRSGPGDVS
jgi:hypothetical protein